MNTGAVLAMVRKDLALFFHNRRALVLSFVTPIAIAAFFGMITGPRKESEASRIPILVVDQDRTTVTRALAAGLAGDSLLEVKEVSEADARAAVKEGKAAAAVLLPAGFGKAASAALFSMGAKPEMPILYDPSRSMELGVVRGVLVQHTMEAVSQEVFGGSLGRDVVKESLARLETATMAPTERDSLKDLLGSVSRWQDHAAQEEAKEKAAGKKTDRPAMGIPFTAKEEAMTAREGVVYNGFAHSFGGMAIQFILFATLELGVAMLLERERGLWNRLRAAPVSKASLIAGKLASGTIVALLIFWVTMGVGILVFGIRVLGSFAGLAAISVAYAALAAAFGLLVAALGRTPEATRGVAIFGTLLLVMLGGAWVPAFIFPRWLNAATLATPTRWAMDGIDAMTWRGLGLGAAVGPVAVLAGSALIFSLLALWRLRWEEA